MTICCEVVPLSNDLKGKLFWKSVCFEMWNFLVLLLHVTRNIFSLELAKKRRKRDFLFFYKKFRFQSNSFETNLPDIDDVFPWICKLCHLKSEKALVIKFIQLVALEYIYHTWDEFKMFWWWTIYFKNDLTPSNQGLCSPF